MSEGFHVCNRSRGNCPILVMSPDPRDSVGISTWNGGFQSLVWPDEKEIDIIELLEPSENGALRGVTSLPSTLVVRVPIELDFNLQQY